MIFNLLYFCLLALGSPVVAYRMIRHGRYRRGVGQKLWGLSPDQAVRLRHSRSDQPDGCLWIHAVSVGEVNLLPGLVEQLQERLPQAAIVISTSTDTGYDLAVKLFGQSRVFFCPLDFSWAARRTFQSLRPSQLILTELELWPNLIRTAKAQGAQVCVINGRLSKRSANRYQQFAKFTRPLFASLDWVGCQDHQTAQRFAACGVPSGQLAVTGSIKFDNAPDDRHTPEVQALAAWAGVAPRHRVWIVGSTQAGEEAMAIAVYQRLGPLHPELRLILVPRHAERFDGVASLIENVGYLAHRRSTGQSFDHQQWPADQIVLVDTIGELRDWWGVGHIATVGGSFGDRGGQNMIEPAGYGLAVSFGPNTKNFQVIAERLVEASGAVRVANEVELERFVRRYLCDLPAADSLGRSAKAVVAEHRGAIKKTTDALAPVVPVDSRGHQAA